MHLLLSEYEGRLCACQTAHHRVFPFKKNTERKEHGSRKLWILHCRFLAVSWDALGARAGPGEGAGADRGVGEMAGWVGYFVDCSCCLGSPHPFGEFSFLCQSKMERDRPLRADAAGRTRSLPTAPALSPRPVACQAVCRVLRAALPALGLLGRQHGLALHCAWTSILASVTTRGRLGAQPCIARPTIPLPVFRPHSRSTFFFFPCPPHLSFCAVANLGFLSSLLPFFFPPFFFSLVNARSQGRGRLGEL